ncbi:MAG: hypothetical protein ABIJ95_01580 [Pseudomonadota bacterium]
MNELFTEVLGIENVHGAMVVSDEGKILFQQFNQAPVKDVGTGNWAGFVSSLSSAKEADLIFESRRIFARRMTGGYVLVVTGLYAPISMVRLSADVLVPAVEKQINVTVSGGGGGGLRRLFRRK